MNDEKVRIEYMAWISSRGEKRHIKDGALFAGLARDIPAKYKHLLVESENRQYCIVMASNSDPNYEDIRL